MKSCPFCKKQIQDKAIKCKHCGSMLTSGSAGTPPDSPPPFVVKSPGTPVSPHPYPDGDLIDDDVTMPSYNEGTFVDGRGRYKVLCKLGEGGMGKVYLTKDMALDGQLMAVKILPRQVANDRKAIRDLKGEAIKQMPLNHENIVRLYHYDHEGDVHYLVMEYVNGVDLQTYLGVKGKLPEKEVRRIGIEIAKGLRHAHSQTPPVVHRDIKPANILLESPKLNIEAVKNKYPNLTDKDIPDLTGARVKITDFGIARQVRESMSRYSRGDTSGTLMYMSPEQMRGKGVDQRSDLYSLGVTLYELLTGDPPFTGDSLAHQILSEEPEPIEKVSARMNDILLKLLSKDKDHRYADADALIRALEDAFAADEEGKAPGAWAREGDFYWEECRRNNTLEAYRRYLARYPQGRYTSAARAEISKIEKAGDQKRERESKESEAKRKQAEEDAFWEECRGKDTLEAYRRYLARYPQGKFVSTARVEISKIEKAAQERQQDEAIDSKARPIQPEEREIVKDDDIFSIKRYIRRAGLPAVVIVSCLFLVIFVGSVTGLFTGKKKESDKRLLGSSSMRFVLIPSGTFVMGSSADESGRHDDELQHRVTISRSFYLQTTEVTQGQWKQVMGNNPSYFAGCGDDCPVENVSWNDVQAFIRTLNSQEGTNRYRLPTEAEWEYAARAGSAIAYFYGSDAGRLGTYGWYNSNSGKRTYAVGQKRPNAWGLYDMHGNVWEWVQDWHSGYSSGNATDPKGPSSGSHRVFRGGSWFGDARYCRSAYRNYSSPGRRYSSVGFRLAKTK